MKHDDLVLWAWIWQYQRPHANLWRSQNTTGGAHWPHSVIGHNSSSLRPLTDIDTIENECSHHISAIFLRPRNLISPQFSYVSMESFYEWRLNGFITSAHIKFASASNANGKNGILRKRNRWNFIWCFFLCSPGGGLLFAHFSFISCILYLHFQPMDAHYLRTMNFAQSKDAHGILELIATSNRVIETKPSVW